VATVGELLDDGWTRAVQDVGPGHGRFGTGAGPDGSPAPVLAALDAVACRRLADVRAAELSGGQRQRVALARATVVRPSAALHEPTSRSMCRWRLGAHLIRELRARLGMAVLFVTHDLSVAGSSRTGSRYVPGRMSRSGRPRS